MVKIADLIFLGVLLVGLMGCESSRSVTSSSSQSGSYEKSDEFAQLTEGGEALTRPESSSVLAKEAAEKYRLASQLLDFAGPIDDFSDESKNVRRLATDLLKDAIRLDPAEFKYYRDLFMTYMVLQEPVKAMEAIEPARKIPALAHEVAEFQALVFGALEYVASIDSES